MNNEFADFTKNTRIAREAWNSKKMTPDHSKSFSSLVGIWRSLNSACVNAYERLQADLKDLHDTYAPNVYAERAATKQAEYQDLVNTNRKSFSDKVNAVADAKIAEVDRIISKTGDPDLINLIQNLSMRSEVSDREWSAVISRVASSNDYQANAMLCDVAKKLNRSYKMPFDAEEIISEIESVRDRFLHMASILDKPRKEWTLSELEFAGEYDNHLTPIQEKINRLDTAPGVAVSIKGKSLVERLKEAQQIARDNMDNATANAIARFLYEKASFVADHQVVGEFYKDEAEALINKAVINATAKGSKDFDSLVKYFTPTASGSDAH